MSKKKYLPLYYEWMKTGIIPDSGLCNSLQDNEFKVLFSPDWGHGCTGYYGYDGEPELEFMREGVSWHQFRFEFTPLRQTMVLLLAAMNNEL